MTILLLSLLSNNTKIALQHIVAEPHFLLNHIHENHRFLPFYVKNPENKPSKGSFAAGLVFLLYHFLTKPAASAVFCLKSQ
ncbi:MAG: hypothetical protein K5900_09385, partial [Butyrivibrio sp.]|nr:hypothetical protein [Butyrivibrio sp.]